MYLPASQLSARVTKVEIVGGDAHVICVSNKIKHIFEFNVKLNFSLDIDESMGLSPQSEVCCYSRMGGNNVENKRVTRTVFFTSPPPPPK